MVPSIPENAPFNQQQRTWLNGFLAGLFAASQQAGSGLVETPSARKSIPLLILFGSQTGTAEGLARHIAKEAKSRGYVPRVMDASAHSTVDWSSETNLLVVTSTYGDGDMPDNAQSFWNWMNSDAGQALAHLNFSVLALGDTSYADFCAAGKKIDARLEQLGAKRFYPRADCDLDYDTTAKEWTDGALGKLGQETSSFMVKDTPASLGGQSPAPVGTTAQTERHAGGLSLHEANEVPILNLHGRTNLTEKPQVAYNRANPFPARLLKNHKLNLNGAEKETRHFALSFAEPGLTYEAGDALGVWPTNCPGLVDEILRALGYDGEEAVPTPKHGELSLRKALANHYDITKPSATFVEFLATTGLPLPLRGGEGRGEGAAHQVIDLLLQIPKARFNPTEFVTHLKPLAPRLYSISSSPKAHPGEVHLTVSIVRYHTLGRKRKGVASTFLADRGQLNSVPVFIQPSAGFRLPVDGNVPIIMVGPGTGIAPFRAFLHERRATSQRGANWLFFGEQHAATDFYYRDELEQMRADGHLTRLDTAFSRDQPEKVYVQHRMLERAAELWSWLADGAHFYVCGDATRMAKDVDAALHRITETAGGLGAHGAADFVAKLRSEKRYHRDVY